MGRVELASTRLSLSELRVIRIAAKVSGKTLSAYVRDLAVSEAEHAVLAGTTR